MMSDIATCRCGAAVHPSDPTRCENGHVLAGYPGPALKHGARSFEQRGAIALPPEFRLTVEEFRQAIISDRGGLENLSAIESGYVRRLAELETVARLLASDLGTRGVFTERGRVRSTLAKWLEVANTWDRYAQRIGLERRAKQVASLAEYLTEGDE